MAGTISSLGVGSGIDTASIVDKLMTLEKLPLKALQTKQSALNTKLSSYGQLKSALDALQTAAKTLADPNKLAGLSASFSNTGVLKAETGIFASPGTYTINVSQLATAQKSFTNAITGNPAFGAGTLKFSVGGEEKTVDVGDGASLNDIRAAINAANIGVTATVISGNGGDRLVLSGTATGAAGGFSVTASGDSSLNALVSFDASLGIAAQNAELTIDGVAVTSSSNTLTSALTGMTLSLTGTGATTMTVARDANGVSEAVNAFVKAFNDVISRIKSDTAWDSASKTGKPLNAESTVRSVMQMLSNTRSSAPDGLGDSVFQTLSSLGISVQKDGLLTVDNTKLTNAINTSFADVQKTLGAFGQAFSATVDQINGTNGLIANRVNGLNNSVRLLQDDQDKLQMRLDMIQKRYQAQFTALDTLMSSLQTTSSYLTQQLAALSNNRN
ncbi:MAG: flagellar filament capping protein FliD [Betaproteobacteria bacterium]|nr:flagellar filament capping protein FliD [Betaproteobacteria bacterium]MCL2885345.1 flagellar filament capping protein FliD [Betaproteobacteria bacterium]